jgi:hypothetical protein
MFLEHIKRLLNLDLGFGYGQIEGVLSTAGGKSLSPGALKRIHAGTTSENHVNLSVADPRAFPGWDGPFMGLPVNRQGRFSSTSMPPGAYLLDWGPTTQKTPGCPTEVVVHAHRTTNAKVPVNCPTK